MFYTPPSAVWLGMLCKIFTPYLSCGYIWNIFFPDTRLSALTLMLQYSWEDILCDAGEQEKICVSCKSSQQFFVHHYYIEKILISNSDWP